MILFSNYLGSQPFQKSRIRETLYLSNNMDSSTNTKTSRNEQKVQVFFFSFFPLFFGGGEDFFPPYFLGGEKNIKNMSQKSVHIKCPQKVSTKSVHKNYKGSRRWAEGGRKVSGRRGATERQGTLLTPPFCTVGCCCWYWPWSINDEWQRPKENFLCGNFWLFLCQSCKICPFLTIPYFFCCSWPNRQIWTLKKNAKSGTHRQQTTDGQCNLETESAQGIVRAII